jgi:hypothetical protein
MTPNVALLKQTLAYIESHPEEWDQATWHCGTTACFAGRAALLEGGQWISDESACMVARGDDPRDDVFSPPNDAPRVLVEDRARRVLGLTVEQSFALFRGDGTLDDLRAVVAEITGGAS